LLELLVIINSYYLFLNKKNRVIKMFFADQFWSRYISSRAKIIFCNKTNWLLANDRSESRLL